MDAAELNYVVEGRWPFPRDMLRRDRSRPATEADELMVARLSGESDESGVPVGAKVRLTLVKPGPGLADEPNRLRWRSFGWEVVSPGDFFDIRESEERLARCRDLRSALAKLSPAERAAIEWYAGRKLEPEEA